MMKPKQLAKYGRNGDTMVAHINPREAKLLGALGGSGTINPKTGLREYYIGMGEDTAADIADAFADAFADDSSGEGSAGVTNADVAEYGGGGLGVNVGFGAGIGGSGGATQADIDDAFGGPSVDEGGFGDFMGPAPEDAVTFDAPVAEPGTQSFPSFGRGLANLFQGKPVDPVTTGIYGTTNAVLGGLPAFAHGALSTAFGPPTGMADMDPNSPEGQVGGPSDYDVLGTYTADAADTADTASNGDRETVADIAEGALNLRQYNPYLDDYATYGQRGEHKFFSPNYGFGLGPT